MYPLIAFFEALYAKFRSTKWRASLTLFGHYWERRPALFAALVSTCTLLSWQLHSSFYLLPASMVVASLCNSKQKGMWIVSSLLPFAFFFFYTFQHSLPSIPEQGAYGTIHFVIQSAKKMPTPFGSTTHYFGYAKTFQPSPPTDILPSGKNLPVVLSVKKKGPPPDCDYQIAGTLFQKTPFQYRFKPAGNHSWTPISNTYSFAKKRASLKKQTKQHILKKIPRPMTGDFLSGLLTGEFFNRELLFLFKQFGLSHLMAISGFHFGILASIVAVTFRAVFPSPLVPFLVVLFLTVYFVFLGPTPSIFRAWVMTTLMFFSISLSKEACSHNSLGIALLLLLCLDPFAGGKFGFLLSFLITWSILLWYPISLTLFSLFYPTRRVQSLLQCHILDQHAYIICQILKKTLALLFAVNITAIPLSFAIFHEYAIMGLALNTLIPFLVSFILFLLLISLVLSFLLPPLGNFAFFLTDHLASFTLHLLDSIPLSLHSKINYSLSPSAAFVCLTFGFCLAIFIRQSLLQQQKLKEGVLLI